MSKIGDVLIFQDFNGDECEGQLVSIQYFDGVEYFLITTQIDNDLSDLEDDNLVVNHVCCGKCENCTCNHSDDDDDDDDDYDDDCYMLVTCISTNGKLISIDNNEELASQIFSLYCEDLEQEHLDRLEAEECDKY